MSVLWVEIKSAYQALNHSRGFFYGVVALLALAIAASCGAFSVPASLLLRPLPIHAPQRLLRLNAHQFGESSSMPWSYPDFKSFQDTCGTVFSGMSNFSVMGVYFDSRGRVQPMPAADVGGAFFQTLGLHAFLGRTLVPSDDTAANPAWLVVVSRAFWQHQLHSDPQAVGSMLHLSGHAFRLVGVVDGHGVFSSLIAQPQIFIPTHTAALLSHGNALNQEGARWIQTIFARLRPGVSRIRAQQQVDAVAVQLRQRELWKPGWIARLDHAGTFASFIPNVSARTLHQAQMVWVASLFVVLIVLANVVSLFLVRALKRVRDQAVSMALGARWWQRALPGLAEGLLIGVIAGVIGLLLSIMLSAWLMHWSSLVGKLPLLDWRVAMYALLLVVGATLVIGFAPMLALDARRLIEYLTARRSETRGQGHLRSALVALQVAISTALLIASLFVLRSLITLQQTDLGFDPSRYLVAQLDFSQMLKKPRFDAPQGVLDAIQHAVNTVPGVAGSSFSTKVPFDGISMSTNARIVNAAQADAVSLTTVADNYFQVMGMKQLLGRPFSAYPPGQQDVVMVNHAFVNKYMGVQGMPIGKETRIEGRIYRIAGVVSDIRADSPTQPPEPYVYFRYPALAGPYLEMTIASTGAQATPALAHTVSAALHRAMPQLPDADVTPMSVSLQGYYASREAIAKTLGIAGLVALIVVVLGIYTALSYDLALRRHAHAVWMALGARPAHIVAWSVRRGVTLVAIGLILGSVAGVYAMRFLQRYLYAVTLRDALLVLFVAGVLLLVAVISALVSSRSVYRLEVAELLHEL